MQQKIFFNGKEYSSLEEMPPEIRQAYEQMMSAFADKNQNGVPDMFEDVAARAAAAAAAFKVFQFNGQTFNALEQMPPEARQAYEQAMKALSEIGEGGGQHGLAEVIQDALKVRAAAMQSLTSQSITPPALVGQSVEAQPVAPQLIAPQPIAPQARPAPMPSPSALSDDLENSGRNLKLFIVGLVLILVLLVIAGGVALFLFNPNLLPR